MSKKSIQDYENSKNLMEDMLADYSRYDSEVKHIKVKKAQHNNLISKICLLLCCVFCVIILMVLVVQYQKFHGTREERCYDDNKNTSSVVDVEEIAKNPLFSFIDNIFGIDIDKAVIEFNNSLDKLGETEFSDEEAFFISDYQNIIENKKEFEDSYVRFILKVVGTKNEHEIKAILIDDFSVINTKIVPDDDRKVYVDTSIIQGIIANYMMCYGKITDIIVDDAEDYIKVKAIKMENVSSEKILEYFSN